MARKPADKVGRVGSREWLWAMIRTLRTFTIKQLREESNLCHDTVRAYVVGLFRAGYLNRDEGKSVQMRQRGCNVFPAHVYTLVKDRKDAPRVRDDGTPVTMGNARLQMWRTMQVLKAFTPRELAVNASLEESPVNEDDARDYLGHLYKAGYLTVVYRDGGAYKLKPGMHTGPKAPMIQRVKRVWDPNLMQVMCVMEPGEGAGHGKR